MGKGSVIVLAGIYLASLILMTGLRPIHLVRQRVLATRKGMVAFRLWLLRRKMRKANLKEQLEISQQQIAKQQTRDRKEAAQKRRGRARAGIAVDHAGRVCQSSGTESGRYNGASPRFPHRGKNLRSQS